MGLTIPPRRSDWRAKLTGYVLSAEGQGFRPGKLDCALFCAGAVEAMTGFDGARGWRGYRTLSEGQKRLVKAGFNDWWDMIADREIGADRVGIGDIALVPAGDELAAGICMGVDVVVVGPDGRGLVRADQIKRGFRV